MKAAGTWDEDDAVAVALRKNPRPNASPRRATSSKRAGHQASHGSHGVVMR